MDYNVQATGTTSDGARDELEGKIRDFVATLPGVTGAWFQGSDNGESFSINVREAVEETVEEEASGE